MLDALSIGLGLLVGGGAAFALTRRRASPPAPLQVGQLTTAWRLSELQSPVLVAQHVDAEVPDGAKVLASGLVDPGIQARCEVREVPPVRAEFALDVKNRRALMFLGGVTGGSMAYVTSETALVDRLEAEYRRMADRSSEYVERFRIADLAGRTGVTVETEGFVQDVLPYKERFLLRLEDAGAIIGVLVTKDPSSLQERRVRVRGRLDKDPTGYAVIEASELRPIG